MIPANPFGPDAGLIIAFRILKCALIPFVPNRLKDAGIDPLAALPPSSPVLKHGFEPDARSACKMLVAHPGFFFEPSEQKRQVGHIKDLTRTRDRWAHQQELKSADFQRVCDLGHKLLTARERRPEASALRFLSKPFDSELQGQLSWLMENDQFSFPAPVDALRSALDLDPTLEDEARLNRLLIHQAASGFLSGSLPTALSFVVTSKPDEVELPSPVLWWTLGLAHDAPVAERRAAWQTAISELAGRRHSSY